MKDYIKMFQDLQSANGYIIKDIPFIATASGETPQNVHCNLENKKIEVTGDNIGIVDAGIPNDEVWYTSSDGNIVAPYSTSALPNIVSNTYADGKGIIKFKTNVTNIGTSAFYNCNKLTSVTIPNSVTSIGSRAFSSCGGLKSVVIPNSVTSIDTQAFFNCTSLTSVVIPDSVTSIGDAAFQRCSGLTSVTIGNSVTSIEDSAFWGCSSLPVINNIRYADTYLLEAIDKTLTSYTIKNGTKWIGDEAFSGCTGLTSVTIPNGVTSIEHIAFRNCSSLTAITIPDSVARIRDNAFENCTSFPVIDNCRYADTYLIGAVDKTLTSYTIKDGTKFIGGSAFSGCGSLTSVTIPNSVTSIGGSVFSGCSSLASIEIPNGVTSIGDEAFSDCGSLTSVTIPNSVTSIGSEAFYSGKGDGYSGSLETITVGETVYTYDGYSESFEITLGNGTNVELLMWTYYCFLPGTQITLADGTTKAVEDITYNDELKVWNFDKGCYDTAYPIWISRPGRLEKYYVITLEDGTVLKVAGANSGHKIYNIDEHKFEGCVTIKVGTYVYTENGIKEIVSKETIEENVTYYNLMTDRHINCFAESVLTSMRYNSIYPFSEDMKFIKDGRAPRPYSEFEAVGISRYWYDGLRLAEQTDTLERISAYIKRLENKMLPKE